MAVFRYRAYDNSGAKFEGELDAASQEEAISELKLQGLIPSDVSELKEGGRKLGLFSSGVNLADLEFLTSELSLLLKSGVRIDRGIDIIRKNKAKPALASLLADISKKLTSGQSLASAAREHPKVFSELYCNLIDIGEASGSLPKVFEDLAEDLKFRRDLQSKIVGALTYPMVIFFVCLLSVFFVFNFIIPRMAPMFDGLPSLPWYTEALLSVSSWLDSYQSFLLVGVIAFGGFVYLGLQKAETKKKLQGILLSTPVFKNAILVIERIRFNGGISLMLRSGLAIDKAISLSLGNISNPELKRELEIARDKVKRGSSVSQSLKQTSIYPSFFISLLEVGEESGNLEAVFTEITQRSRQEFESWTSRITTLLEPLMILFMGGMVGGIVIIMLMSMVSVNDFGI